MENPNDKDLQHLDKYLERLMQRQDEIDKKAKDAQIYRDYNVKLLGLLKILVIGFLCCIFFCACALGISSVLIAKEYFTYEQGIVRTVTEESDTISGAGNSVIMNRSNGETINGKGKGNCRTITKD
jgi:hypothetical protein